MSLIKVRYCIPFEVDAEMRRGAVHDCIDRIADVTSNIEFDSETDYKQNEVTLTTSVECSRKGLFLADEIRTAILEEKDRLVDAYRDFIFAWEIWKDEYPAMEDIFLDTGYRDERELESRINDWLSKEPCYSEFKLDFTIRVE